MKPVVVSDEAWDFLLNGLAPPAPFVPLVSGDDIAAMNGLMHEAFRSVIRDMSLPPALVVGTPRSEENPLHRMWLESVRRADLRNPPPSRISHGTS